MKTIRSSPNCYEIIDICRNLEQSDVDMLAFQRFKKDSARFMVFDVDRYLSYRHGFGIRLEKQI